MWNIQRCTAGYRCTHIHSLAVPRAYAGLLGNSVSCATAVGDTGTAVCSTQPRHVLAPVNHNSLLLRAGCPTKTTSLPYYSIPMDA